MKKLLPVLFLFLFPVLLIGQDCFAPLDGPRGTGISSSCFDSTGNLFVAIGNKGIYRSNNYGDSWEAVNEGLSSPMSRYLIAAPNGDVIGASYHSYDKLRVGQNVWENIDLPSDLKYPWSIATGSDSIMYMSVENRLYRSFDNGDSYEWYRDSPADVRRIIFKGNNQNYIWGDGDEKFIYRLADNGEVVEGLNVDSLGYIRDMIPTEGGGLLITIGSEVWKNNSLDSSWTDLTFMFTDDYLAFYQFFQVGGDEIFLIGAFGNYITKDGGNSFSKVEKKPHSNLKDYPVFSKSSEGVKILGNWGQAGIFRSFDEGENWERIDKTFKWPNTKSIIKDNDGFLYAEIDDFNQYERSMDDGKSWNAFFINDSKNINKLAIDSENNFFAITDNGHVYRSFDSGDNWEFVYQLNPFSHYGIKATLNDEILMYDRTHFLRSVDHGNNWILIDSTNTWGIARHPSGSLYHLNGVLRRSDDSGISWDTMPKVPYFSYFPNIHIDIDGNVFVLGLDHSAGQPDYWYLYSSDNGVTFNVLSRPTSNPWHIATTSTGKIITSNSKEIYISEGIDYPWKNINQGISSNSRISHLFVDKEDYIYVGMGNDVIYKSFVPASQITSTEVEDKNLFASVVSPNPFDDEFKLELENDFSSPLLFQLKNQNGSTVIEKPFTGKTLEIKRNNLPSGIYFYSIYSDEKIIAAGKVIAQ